MIALRRFIASGLRLGLLPRRVWGSDRGAGTVGAALAAVISLALWRTPIVVQAVVAAAAVLISLWAAQPFTASGADPGWIVVDEVAGTLVALIGLVGWPWLVALLVSRVADITKVFPGVAEAERLPGAIGVTLDDVVAGLYGLAAGWLTVAIL